ncbi:FAD-dependent monooxygenase nscC [Penicillium coprophilum]|uniref:FAD-dependent monooxygenase nscC n=1 Tax=Penicillium coprophilum TaxID=36646 RepID=UPI0023A4E6D2|nr:FAD-dependent monooxygenase nscC [Penicillium coprophilum]KAJ5173528.1 FAD-dependent monooxygenase nscC [Penicillium coprophilum]
MNGTRSHPILIIGAGISGITTGRLLTNAGIPNIPFAISLREWGYSSLLTALGDLPLCSLTRGAAPDRLLGKVLVAPELEQKQSIRSWKRCHEAVRRSQQRFFQLHRPMKDWQVIAEKKRRLTDQVVAGKALG